MRSEEALEPEASFLQRFLLRLVGFACRRPRIVVATAVMLCALSIYLSCTRLTYRTQRSDLISPQKEYQQRWRQYVEEFGEDEDMVVVVKGSDHYRMRQALENVASEVRKHPEHFDRLFHQVDLRALRNRALLFLPNDQLKQIQDNLKSMTLLLESGPLGWRGLTVLQLLREGVARARAVDSQQPLGAADHQFFAQLLSVCRAAGEMLSNPATYRNPWNSLMAKPPEQQDFLAEPQYFFSGDGTLAFLLARPHNDKTSFTGSQESVEAMRGIVAATRTEFPDLEIGLTGMPVLETDEMVAARRDTQAASWLAIGGVSLLFLVVYRGIYYPMLTVGTLLLGTSLAMGWTTLTVGHLNILSATFAVMLIGMGDYGVLWVMRYEHERRMGADVGTALHHTAICVGAGTMTAALTTALAFYAAMLADFQAVAELGWIAGSGVVLCALSCFTMLPAVLTLCDRRTLSRDHGSLSVNTMNGSMDNGDAKAGSIWLPGLAGKSGRVVAAGLALTAILAVFACRLTYDHNMLHLQARDLESVQWELTLIEHTAGASWHAVSYTESPQEALALKARYEALPEVSRVVELATLVPPDQDEKLEMVRDIQRRLRWLPQRESVIAHDCPDFEDWKRECKALAGVLQPLADTGSCPLLRDLCDTLTGLSRQLQPEMAERMRDFEQRLAGDLAGDLHQLRDVATPAPVRLGDLPDAMRERYVGKNGKWLLQVYAKDSLWDFEPLEHFTRQIQTVDAEATGQPFGTVEGLKAMKNGFQWAGVYAFFAIAIVLYFDFRNVKRTLIALSPLVMGVTIAVGLMAMFGVALNPANMIAVPLVLGVGVDNGVHVLHDFLARKLEGRGKLSRAIGRGVLVKALTTMIGFGTLMISSQRGLMGLGFCLSLGVGCCMLTALVFLPALLHWSSVKQTEASSETELEAPRLAA
jgi:hopanoid biosynthesis associated RND transporter like protein HpnN